MVNVTLSGSNELIT